MKDLLKNKYILILIGLVIGGTLVWLIKPSNDHMIVSSDNQSIESSDNQIWTCSMHPQIRQSEPGQCPICGMNLIPLNNESSSDENPMVIKMSPTAMQLANVQTLVITMQKPVKEVRINGKIKADERNVSSQAAHIPGRVEKLLVNYTGESVRKGQVLAYIYSPDLVTAQEELLEAYKIKESQPELYQAARGKLLNWKLTEKQINTIIQSGEKQEQFPVLADVSGVVMIKQIDLGDYVRKGQSLFEIADLTKVWVLFDVYESDIQWIKKGDKTSFTIHSLPGETFVGKITFVDPVINPKTRVATARVEMANPGMKLKPEMFVVGIIKSPLQNEREALIVPKSAVMWTGQRSVVYVKQASVSGINFIMREVTLGAALGESYIIKEGLEAGEEIATNGTFSIDAAAQLAGKPSMMNPEGGAVKTGHDHGGTPNKSTIAPATHSQTISVSKKAKEALISLFDEYVLLKDALVADDFDNSKQIAASLAGKLSKTNMGLFTGDAHDVWMLHSGKIKNALRSVEKAENIGDVRRHFKTASDQFIMVAVTFGPFDAKLYIQHCPMADKNNGADWISAEKKILNPYFGKSMIGCGEVTREIK